MDRANHQQHFLLFYGQVCLSSINKFNGSDEREHDARPADSHLLQDFAHMLRHSRRPADEQLSQLLVQLHCVVKRGPMPRADRGSSFFHASQSQGIRSTAPVAKSCRSISTVPPPS
ncbi:hypothetical protein VTK73DRAFT_6332 [Phialemonium thermophilum]|uniref:Uncharacterized protein n=1 Tax=Phialemonium thermophilum TaxID=223376 RepID=A0ABR3V0Z5_9PEZI